MAKNPNRVKAGKRAKTKGNNNERALAAAFARWWGWGEWVRTPSSGGWATATTREAFRTCGDIMTTATDFPFVVEAKKQEKWQLDDILHSEKSAIFHWWKQAVEETPPPLDPLLVIARNHMPQVVVFRSHLMGWSRLSEMETMGLRFVVLNHLYDAALIPSNVGAMHGSNFREKLVFMPLTEFFKISPTAFGRRQENVEPKSTPEGSIQVA